MAALPDTPEATCFKVDLTGMKQLFKEQDLDQVPQFVNMQHYDLRGYEPSYQAFHLIVLDCFSETQTLPLPPFSGVGEVRRFGTALDVFASNCHA